MVTLTSIGFNRESVYAEDREPVKLVLDEGVTHLAINGKLLYSEENNIDLINSNFNLIVPYGSQIFLDYDGEKFNAEVAKPNSSAPNIAIMTMSRPVFI